MKQIFCNTYADISSNCRIKEYPTYYELCAASSPIFRESGWEEQKPSTKVNTASGAKSDNDNKGKALRRARAAIRDIASCSAFTHFVTLTLNAAVIDRCNYAAAIKPINRWLSNMVQRKGFAYVLVPEYHADGEAIHFHGLCRGDVTYIDSMKKTKRGQPILNMKEWKFGFTDCVKLDEHYERVCNYIMKYITKDSEKIGGRYYLSGGDISKPKILYTETEYRDIDAKEYYCRQARTSFKYQRIAKEVK